MCTIGLGTARTTGVEVIVINDVGAISSRYSVLILLSGFTYRISFLYPLWLVS